MQKSLKRTLSLILAVVMLCAVLTVAPFTAGAATADSEAVGWNQVESGEITPDQTGLVNYSSAVSISTRGDIALLKFVPARDMAIEFYSTTSVVDTYGYIYASNKAELATDNDSAGSQQFKISYHLTANTTYYFGARFYSSSATGTIYYTIEEKPLWVQSNGKITKYNGAAADVTVPTEVDGVAITEIGAEAFMYNTSITSVTIPAEITTIGLNAFEYCSNLTTLVFEAGSSLTEIQDYAFYACNRLKYVNLPEGLTRIGSYAFAYCGSDYQYEPNGRAGYLIIPSTVTDASSSEINQTAFGYARFNSFIVKAQAPNLFNTDFDNTLYGPYAAAYENSNAEYALEHTSNAAPNVGTVHHIKYPFTVTYDANLPAGVEANVPEAYTSSDDIINISDVTPTGGANRTFLGWGFSPTSARAAYLPGDEAAFCADVTLYAIWEDKLTFIDGEETVKEATISLAAEPDGSGYLNFYDVRTDAENKVLMGYYTAPNGQETQMFVKSGYSSVKSAEYVTQSTLMDAADASGEIKLYAYWADSPEFYGSSLSLNGDVTVNFYFTLPEGKTLDDYQSAYLSYSTSYYGNNNDINLKDSENCTFANGLYKVSVRKYFKEMADEFNVSLQFNDTSCGEMEGYSVKSYANAIISGSKDDELMNSYSYSDEKLTALKNLCMAMLNLGAKAQEQFGYSTYNLANEGLSYDAPALNPDELSEPDYTAEGGAKFSATNVYINKTGINFVNKEKWEKVYINYYDNNQDENVFYELSKSGETYTIDEEAYDVYPYTFPSNFSGNFYFTDIPNAYFAYENEVTGYNQTGSSYFYEDEYVGCYYYPSYSYEYENYTYWGLDYNRPDSSTADIRFVNTAGWENVYVWNVENETFPGTQMTYLETNEYGEDVYSAPRPESNAKLVFSDGTESNRTTSVEFVKTLEIYDNEGYIDTTYNLPDYAIPMWMAVPCDVFTPLGISYEGSNIGLLNQTGYGIILRNNSAEGLTLTKGEEVIEGTQIQLDLDDNYMYYRFYDIPAAEITNDITLTIHVNSVTDAKTGTVTNPQDLTVAFNPVSYIKKALKLDDSYAALKAAVTALYDFNQKAISFFETN